jgi:ribose transport system substrate-binding protein
VSARTHLANVLVTAGCVAAVLVGAGCGSSDSGGSGGSEKRLTVGYSSKGSDQFMLVLQNQAMSHLKAAGLKALQPTASQNDPGRQITDVRNLVSGGANAMLVAPGDSAAIAPAISFLNAKKIPTVALDTSPSTSAVAIVVRTDNYGAGALGCQQIGKALSGQGTALALQGDYNSDSGLDRGNGFLDCMRKNFPGIKVIDRHMDWKTDLCAQIVNSQLRANKDIDAIYMASETICMAPLLTALKTAGRDDPSGQPDHVFTVGIDGSPFALKMVREGKLDVDLSQPLDLYAKYGVEYLQQAAEGKTFRAGPTVHGTKVVRTGKNLVDLLPVTVVTKSNATSRALWGNAVEQ